MRIRMTLAVVVATCGLGACGADTTPVGTATGAEDEKTTTNTSVGSRGAAAEPASDSLCTVLNSKEAAKYGFHPSGELVLQHRCVWQDPASTDGTTFAVAVTDSEPLDMANVTTSNRVSLGGLDGRYLYTANMGSTQQIDACYIVVNLDGKRWLSVTSNRRNATQAQKNCKVDFEVATLVAQRVLD